MLGRTPTFPELGIFSALWSEHCSYKHSRPILKTLPTTGPQVVQGPGENAGVLRLPDGWAVAFKIESHNHPSAVEPYQGAATGVGGIPGDVFTMGARPVAVLNSLRFGSLDDARNRYLCAGVVKGVGDYGNCVGVPTLGGEVDFGPGYAGNPLVNAMCVGLLRERDLITAAAHGVGNVLLVVGSRTGRDGIHGASFASEELTRESERRRPQVQVGDPFTEKLLLEASLERIASGHIVAIEDPAVAELRSQRPHPASRIPHPADALLTLLDHPPIASKRWVYEQYDSTVQASTVLGPGGDAGVIRVRDAEFGLAVTVDGNSRYVRLDPYEGGKAVVAEAARNVACTGARPLGITDCLNFGSPERPAVFHQFKESCRGIADACRALGTPVTGGDYSLYNETPPRAVQPPPVGGEVRLPGCNV